MNLEESFNCRACHLLFPLSEIGISAISSNGYNSYCRYCVKVRMNVTITKRGEVYGCCMPWMSGEKCDCIPYIASFYINGEKVNPVSERRESR